MRRHRHNAIIAGLALMLAALVFAGMAVSAAGPGTARQPIFATNTPPPPDPLSARPEAPYDQYALRLWQEGELVDVLARLIDGLADGDEVSPRAVELMQIEMERRFPGAPRTTAGRERLLDVMLAAPRGSVDMRSVVRPYVMERLAERDFDSNIANALTIAGFAVETQPANLDGNDTPDLYIHVRYPAQAIDALDILYNDHLLALGRGDGSFVLPPGVAAFPAAPYIDIISVQQWGLGDLNGDRLDELALAVDRGDVNSELLIYGWRTDDIIGIVQPGRRLVYAAELELNNNTRSLSGLAYQVESERWQCLSAIQVTWEWSANFFRPITDPLANAAYENLTTVGCALHQNEPIFGQQADDAARLVSGILASPSLAPQGTSRAQMALAMLLLLDGDIEAAREQVEMLIPETENDAWLAGQVAAFANTAVGDSFTSIDVCAALLSADSDGACQMDQVLSQLFIENPISRDGSLVGQLESLGLPVLEVVDVVQVGRLPRQVVNFNLPDTSWWAFAPTDPDFYVPSVTDPPVEFAPASFPAGLVVPPQIAYDALRTGNFNSAVSALDNAMRDNPSAPLSPEALFFQALIQDLTGDRQRARLAYFDLWVAYPDSIWGGLAGAHLELRG